MPFTGKNKKRTASRSSASGVGKVIEDVKVAVGLAPQKEESPAAVMSENRSKGEEIVSTLRSIQFAQGQLPDTKSNENQPCGDMEMTRNAILKKIDNAPTIFDQIEGIDRVLLYAARAWKTAVEDGSPNKAEWAMNALSAGVLFLRDNIPEDQEDRKEQILAARVKYMEKYDNIIHTYEEIDNLEKTIRAADVLVDEKWKQVEAFKKRLKEMQETEEGQRLYGRLKAHVDQNDRLTAEERAFDDELGVYANMAYAIDQQKDITAGNKVQLLTAYQKAETFRIALNEQPVVYDETINAQYIALLDEQVAHLAAQYAVAREMSDAAVKYAAARKSVLNGEDAVAIRSNMLAWMEKVQEEDYSVDTISEQIARRRTEQLEEMRKNRAVLENTETNQTTNFDINFDTALNENTEENEAVNEQYNYNT
ncbi:MAG: hypothetical protein LUC87_00270 [Clostridiales bacterium]|nr:hypothetical protein [Clostridiales bacterium]